MRRETRHPFFEGPRPLVFAHRGGAALAPENTLAAFDRGAALGVDGLEVDVRLSRDGIVVVHHDRTLERVAGDPRAVAELTADELARVDAGCRFDPARGQPYRGLGMGVPTLEAVLTRFRDLRVIIDMKLDAAELARRVIGVVRAADALERVCLGSFSTRALQAARALEPAVATSAGRSEVRWAIYRSSARWPVRRVRYAGYQVPEVSGRTTIVSRRFIADAHTARLGVQVWIIDTEADAKRLLEWGVDGLITDRPDVIVPLVTAVCSAVPLPDRH
jgi:glycerophosphoryl diester phosphodiesterase